MTFSRSHPKFVFAALVYFLSGLLGLQLAVPPGYATAIFPAAGVAFSTVLAGGNAFLPAIWLGSFAINNWISLQNDSAGSLSFIVAGAIASGSTLQAWAGAALVRKALGDRWKLLVDDYDIIKFLVISGPVVCIISATGGTITLFMSGAIALDQTFFNWWNWWVGDTIGVLLFAPITLIVLLKK